MRRAERPGGHQSRAGGQDASHRMHLRRLQRLWESQRWQNARQPAREHGFARARRSNQEHVVPPGGGHFERALGRALSPNILEVGHGVLLFEGIRSSSRLGGAELVRIGKVFDHLRKVADCVHIHPLGNGSLGGVLRRHNQILDSLFPGTSGDRQGATNRAYSSIERQLTHEQVVIRAMDDPHRAENA